MDPRQLFVDARLTGACVFCGGVPETRDHVPSKVLLDEPLPRDLPVVEACRRCNGGTSSDEQYLACFLECVLRGSADPDRALRPNIARILGSHEALRLRIEKSQGNDSAGNLVWAPELDRIHKVILKLARGHAAYELYPRIDAPLHLHVAPLDSLDPRVRCEFENLTSPEHQPLPELGTRAFLRALGRPPDPFELVGNWIVVQRERYRYAVVETGGVLVRMVLSEYLACEVIWEA